MNSNQTILEVSAAPTAEPSQETSIALISFAGEGAHRITVTAEGFIEGETSHAALHIADINGADLTAFGCKEGSYVVESHDSKRRDESGDYCLLARLGLKDLVESVDNDGIVTCIATLTSVNAYDSYLSDPIIETRNGSAYLPTKHARLSRLMPIRVTVKVLPLEASA